MKKTLNFSKNEKEYILENTNPNEKNSPFTIALDTMEFDTNRFYEYVFSDINKNIDINIVNQVVDPDKATQRTYDVLVEICNGVIGKMNEKYFGE